MDHPKRYLITGGAGHIGSHVADALIARGDEVVIIDDLSTGKLENLNPAATFVEGSVLDLPLLLGADRRFDAVFHLAAYVNVREGTKNPHLMSERGANLTASALEFTKDRNIPKFVFVSSTVVEYNPRIPYGMEKEMGERYCRYYEERYGLETSIIRLHSVYGSPRHDVISGNVIPSFIDQVKKTGRLQISGDGSQIRDFVYYTDIVNAIVEAENRRGLTEVGTGIGRSILDVGKLFGCPIDFVGRPAGEVDLQVCRNPHYKTVVRLEEGISRVIKSQIPMTNVESKIISKNQAE